MVLDDLQRLYKRLELGFGFYQLIDGFLHWQQIIYSYGRERRCQRPEGLYGIIMFLYI